MNEKEMRTLQASLDVIRDMLILLLAEQAFVGELQFDAKQRLLDIGLLTN